MIIDIHTHVYDKNVYDAYLKKSKGQVSKILVLHWYREDFNKIFRFVESKDNLFFVGNVNIEGNINKQLKFFEKLFKDRKLFGIKLYPGYQYFYPSEKRTYAIAKLCQKYNKPLIFHSGDVWNPEGDAILKYSHPIHIDELAVKFSKCKIIISHFGFPYHLETANIVSKNKNVHTDISGTIDKPSSNQDLRNLLSQYEEDLKRVFSYYPNVKQKVMFGTDYGGEHTPLNQIEPYIKLVKNLFNKEEQKNVFYKLGNKIFFS